MKKLGIIIVMTVTIVSLLSVAAIAKELNPVANGSDVLVPAYLIEGETYVTQDGSAQLPFDASAKLYAACHKNGWLGANPSMDSAVARQRTIMAKEGDNYLAPGLKGKRFVPAFVKDGVIYWFPMHKYQGESWYKENAILVK